MAICISHWHRAHIGPCFTHAELEHATRWRVLISEVIMTRSWWQRHRIWRHSKRLVVKPWLT